MYALRPCHGIIHLLGSISVLVAQTTDTSKPTHLLPEITRNFSLSSSALQSPVLHAWSPSKSCELNGTVLLFKCIACTNSCLCKQFGFSHYSVYSDLHGVYGKYPQCIKHQRYFAYDPVWIPGLRIDPHRLLAGCCKRRLNQAPLNDDDGLE